MLNKDDINRFSRHLLLPEIGMKGQEKLRSAKVLVVGAGGLGCPVLLYLAAAGVGTIGIVDDDVVDVTNLQRQVLFTTEDVGEKKVRAAAKRVSALDPGIHVVMHESRLNAGNALEIMKDYDIVVDGSDNFPTRYLTNDACVLLHKPLVFGSIFRFEGQVSVFNYQKGPTYRCLFPEPPGPGEVPNCSEIGVLGVLPGMIGTLMANETLKIITGAGEVLSGKLFVMDALTLNTHTLEFEKDPVHSRVEKLIDYETFCSSKGPAAEEVKSILTEELKQLLLKKTELQLIDVREPFEHAAMNIGGLNIPLGSLEKHVGEIRKDQPVIVYCRVGNRSRTAIQLLEKKYGFTNLINLTGGMEAW